MNKKWAIQKMLDGKKIRRDSFSDGSYYEMSHHGDVRDEDGNYTDFNYECCSGWEVYEEPRMRIVNKELCNSFQGKPCIVCGAEGCGHHVKSKGSGGDDVKENLMPTCQEHHNEVHTKGLRIFAKTYPVVVEWLKDNDWRFCEFSNKWFRITPDGADLD